MSINTSGYAPFAARSLLFVCLLPSSRNIVIASPLLTYPFADILLSTNSTDEAPKNSANWDENGADRAELIDNNDAMWRTLH